MGHSVKIYLTNCLNLLKLLFRNYSTVLTFITLTFMQNTLLVSSLAFQYRDLCELLPSLLHIWLHLGLYSQIECRPSDSWNCILNSQRREGKAEWWLVLVRPFPVWDLWQQLADWGGGVVPPSPWPSNSLSCLTAGVSWLAGTPLDQYLDGIRPLHHTHSHNHWMGICENPCFGIHGVILYEHYIWTFQPCISHNSLLRPPLKIWTDICKEFIIHVLLIIAIPNDCKLQSTQTRQEAERPLSPIW